MMRSLHPDRGGRLARPARLAAAIAALVASAPLCDCAIDAVCFEDDAGCAIAGCADGRKNGAETDVDCGGPCAPCAEAGACASKADCATPHCTGGRCCAALCVAWGRSFGSLVGDAVLAAAVRSDRSTLLVGVFSGAVDFGGGPLVANGGKDLFVLALSAAGEHLFSASFGGEGDELDAALVLHPDDHATLALTSASPVVDFGGGPRANDGGKNAFLVELDARGKHVRSKVFSAPNELSIRGLARTAGGDLVLAGSFYAVDFGGGALASKGGLDVFVLRLDAGWNHLWSRRFGDLWHDTGQRVAVDGEGNVIVTTSYSRSWSFGGPKLPATGGVESVAIAKLDPAGNHLWSHGYGGHPTGQWPLALVADAAGNAFLAGEFSGSADFGLGPIKAGVARSGFVVAYAPDGAARWSRAIGEHTVSAQGLALDGDGGVLVSGAYRGNVDFGGGLRLEHGLDEVFLARLAADGGAIAARGFGGSARDAGVGVTARRDAAGLRAVVFGGYRGALQWPGATLTSAGESDAFALAVDP